MEKEKIVLCGASAYEKKFYLNEAFDNLPKTVKDELKVMCVLYTEDVGGVITLTFDEAGTLEFEVRVKDDDYMFDEIGSDLKIKKMREDHKELLEAIVTYYRVVFLGEAGEE